MPNWDLCVLYAWISTLLIRALSVLCLTTSAEFEQFLFGKSYEAELYFLKDKTYLKTYFFFKDPISIYILLSKVLIEIPQYYTVATNI